MYFRNWLHGKTTSLLCYFHTSKFFISFYFGQTKYFFESFYQRYVNCRPAWAIFRELHPLTGAGRYVFPSLQSKDRPMSENTVNVALRRMGFDRDTATAHGFRAMARTMAADRLGIDPQVIEAQLAHAVPDALGRAYNRTTFADQRRELMTKWADYLDRLRDGARVLPFRIA